MSLKSKTASKSDFRAKFSIFLQLHPPDSHKPKNDDFPNQVAQLVPLGELLDVKSVLSEAIWQK